MNVRKFSKNAIRLILTLNIIFFFSSSVSGQMRQLYLDNVSGNEIYKLSFYSPSQGYVAFRDWIGYTADSGRTFTKKYITNGNVNFNGYSVNLTFGFGIQGVKAFDQNTIIAYGDYGLVPAILYSTNGGTSYTLIYHSQFNAFELTTGITDMIFPQNGSIGYAVDGDRILKTTNQGLSWFPVLTSPNSCFDHLDAIDNNNVFAVSDSYIGDIIFPNGRTFINNKILKTNNTGTSWQLVNVPAGPINNISFVTPAKGWLNLNQDLYYTSNTGASWTQKNSPAVPSFYTAKMKFINDSTGYSLNGLFEILNTTDSGKIWEPLPRDNNYTYLGYTHNDLQLLSLTQFWAGGGHGFLEMSTNAGGTRLPRAFFSIDTTGLFQTGNVNLINYSRTIYSYQWFLNNTLISTSYNSSYIHDINRTVDTVKLVVSNGTNTDTSTLIQYFYPPVIVSSFTPTAAATGNVVSITGDNFSGTVNVSFGGVTASAFTVLSNTSINATVGAGASGSVKVITGTGQGSKAGFTFISPPTITSFTPTSAAAATTVTITGTNFIGVTAVNLGGVAATSFIVVSTTTITAVAPSGPSGSVTVITPGGTATLAGYISLPTISSFTPLSGTEGTVLTITGTSFSGATAVSVGGVNALSFIVNSSTTISAVVGAGATGTVIVTKPGGTSSLPGFTWYAPPVITSFSPAAGPAGTTVTITGTGFNATAASNIVYFGAVKATVTGGNTTSLTVTVPVGATFKPITVLNNNLVAYSQKPFLVTFSGGSIAANTFATRTIISTGPEHAPTRIDLGDLDGDGKTDLVVPHYSNNAANNGVLLYRNTSTITTVSFDSPVNLSGLDYEEAATGDIDGDGKLDLAVIKANSIAIFINTSTPGTISFVAGPILPAGNAPHGISLGDVDGDGKADIVTSLYPDLMTSVYRNTSNPGNVSFAARVNYAVRGGRNIILTDINGDDKPEIVVPDGSNNGYAVLKNNCTKGNILFGTALSFTGCSFSYFASGDIDGDGKTDLVSGDANVSRMALFRNTSSTGTISFDAALVLTANSTPVGTALSDLDGDGKLDLATVLNNFNLAVFKNSGMPANVSFNPKMDYVPGTFNGEHMVALGDINGDGRNDAVVIAETQRTISVHINDISPVPFIQSFTPMAGTVGTIVTITGSNFTGATSVSFGGVPASSFVVNSSTSITAVVAGGASGSVSVTSPQGTGSLAGFVYLPNISSFSPASGPAGTVVTITGYHLNGVTSVSFGGAAASSFTVVSNTSITAVVGLGATGNVAVADSNGTASLGTFTFISSAAPVITSISPVSAPKGATVTITGSNFNINLLSNNVYFGSVKAQVISGTTTSLSVLVPGSATYDHIKVTSNYLSAVSAQKFFTLFAGGTTFTPQSFADKVDSTANSLADVYFDDLNGDGKLDILISGANGVSTLRNTSVNNGLVSFAPRQDFATSFFSNNIAIADFDGDGKSDIGLTNFSYLVKNFGVIRNISTPSLIKFDTVLLFNYLDFENGNVTAGDFDGDGKIDVAIVNYYRTTVSIYKNITVGANINFAPKVDYPILGGGAGDIRIADMDSDGKPDLVVGIQGAAYGQLSVSVLRNTSTAGNISFAPKVDFIGGDAVSNLQTGDIDGDGKLDIITAGASGATILRNLSTPGNISFDFRIVLSISGDRSYGVSVNDLNGDGKPDLAVGEYWFVDSVALFQNLSTPGNISFAAKIEYVVNQFSRGVTSGDLDGDGKPDIAIIDRIATPPTRVSILRNLSGNTITQACVGSSISINAGVTGSTYQWQQNTGSGFINISDNGIFSGTNSPILQITNIPLSFDGYEYRCLSGGIVGNVVKLSLSSTPLTPSVTITSNPTTVCAGVTVLFTAYPVNGGSSPSYQWKKNGVNVGTNSATYSSNTLVNGDVIIVTLTSNSSCVTTTTAISNSLTINITSVTPSVLISTAATTICAGANATFTAIPNNGGSAPSYQWKVNGLNVGTNSSTFSTTTLTNGSIVTVVLTSSLPCASPAAATSNNLLMNVSAVIPSVSITTPVVNICPGANVTFTATPANGGNSPIYQWKKNGINVGTNSPFFSSATLANGDVIAVNLTSNAPCAGTATVSSNNIIMLVNNTINTSISISGNTTVIMGTSTVITSAITNAGTSFAYQWQDSTDTHTWQNINGSNVSTLNFYTPLVTGNKLRCLLTGVSNCASGGNFIISNSLLFTVNPPGGRIRGYVRYYPNPATSYITVDSLNLKDNWETVSIINMAGAKTGIVKNIAGLTKATINVEALAAGIYIAVLNNRFDGKVFFKFVKL